MKSDLLPLAKDIISEHYRVGSAGIILSRNFIQYNNQDLKEFENEFINKVKEIREVEEDLQNKDEDFFEDNKEIVKKDIYKARGV